MKTIKRIIKIITVQNGFILTTGDLRAVVNMCFAIAGILALVEVVLIIKMIWKQKKEDK